MQISKVERRPLKVRYIHSSQQEFRIRFLDMTVDWLPLIRLPLLLPMMMTVELN